MTSSPNSPSGPPMRLQYAALSDVGQVRKDNQDSGYAGPWLLAVCDGVGGAARGDIASSTTIQQLRRLDAEPGDDQLGLVAGAIHRSQDRLSELVEEDPALNGTSTTATVALFDGSRLAIGHVGDSRAYLYRDGSVSQLTTDHTFVQSLIDEGRITEEEARSHPHRNLILKAVDGVHDAEPDLFTIDLAPGDRIFLCSDGASGVLDEDRLGEILGSGTPDYAAVEMVRASLDAGSSDNVTCVVADVAAADDAEAAAVIDQLSPLLVGAAAELPRRRTGMAGRLLGHRTDTGELDPVPAELPPEVPHAIRSDPIDPEVARYAPRAPHRFVWLKRLAVAAILVGLVWVAAGAAYVISQQQYFVAEHDGKVTIFRGVDADLLGFDLNQPVERSDIELSELNDYNAGLVRDGIEADSLEDARQTLTNLLEDAKDSKPKDEPDEEPTKDSDKQEAPGRDSNNSQGGGPGADQGLGDGGSGSDATSGLDALTEPANAGTFTGVTLLGCVPQRTGQFTTLVC